MELPIGLATGLIGELAGAPVLSGEIYRSSRSGFPEESIEKRALIEIENKQAWVWFG